MYENSKAPRFNAYFEHCKGLHVMTMERSQWDFIVKEAGKLFTVDISTTPMNAVASCVTACVAQQFLESNSITGDGFVDLYRVDPADGTTPINKDKYGVWLGNNLQQQGDFLYTVVACGTEANRNLTKYLNETVYLVKQRPDNDHRLPEVPSEVKLLYRKD